MRLSVWIVLAVLEMPGSHFMGVRLQRDTFDKVGSRLGAAPRLAQAGDGGEWRTFACFRGDDGSVVVFASDAMGGGTFVNSEAFAKEIADLILPDSIDVKTLAAICVRSSHVSGTVPGPVGIHLGQRLAPLEKALGSPMITSDELKTWESDRQLTPTLGRFRRIDVRLRGGRIVAVSVSESTRG
jgi:hypothetical protein